MPRKSNSPAKLRGRIERVYYAGPKFSAGRLLTSTGDEIQFAGNLFARENQPVVLVGTWATHPKYGRQFKVDAMEHDLDLNPEGLIHYLANHPDIKGIGPVKARLIVEEFGDSFEETLIESPELIASKARISLEAVGCLRNEWVKNRSVNTVLAWLSAFGLTHHQVTTLVDKLGGSVIVGDHNQLPPVGPGNILRDLIHSNAIPSVILDKVVRQAGVLKENSTAILKGEVRKTSEVSTQGCRDWYLADQFTDPGAARNFLLDLFGKRLDALGFDLIKDVQVLTPTHKGPLGTKSLNEDLQRLIQKRLWNVSVPETQPGRRSPFLKHDKVIQTRNNYELNVMNGAIGHVVDVLQGGTLLIDFDGMAVEIEKGSSNLQDIQLAYALTIHKTQGSEFSCAVVVIHKTHSFMHHRNLLYTGVTRARKTAIVLGDRWGIRNCAKKCQVDDRKTFLSILLNNVNCPEEQSACAGAL